MFVFKELALSCDVRDLGLIEFDTAYAFQQQCVSGLLKAHNPTIFLCEHPAVITLGRLADESNILVDYKELGRKGVSVKKIDRGGDITLHCPGQLVVYPIIDLSEYGKDLHSYLHQLEDVAINVLSDFCIRGQRSDKNTGVWVKQRKIVSIGIGVKKWITYHGMAINVNTDLNLFSLIRPCGLDVIMTSMADIKGISVNLDRVKERVIYHLSEQFSLRIR